MKAKMPFVRDLRNGLFEGINEEDALNLMALLSKFVHLNNEQSRAPSNREAIYIGMQRNS
ncbi:MAG: hypothetical protein VB135_00935 [Burkholderia sp.]